MKWKIHHRARTESTNLDARSGSHGDVFTADFQTSGRGRLDHRWQSPAGTNLMMSVVLSVTGQSPERVATLPLVVGLSVVRAVRTFVGNEPLTVSVKWPNDVWIDGKKTCGILCEKVGENVIAGIGINVRQRNFPPELSGRATSLALELQKAPSVEEMRDEVLAALDRLFVRWQTDGFSAIYPELSAVDALRGRFLSVRQTDDDANPVSGVSNGIMSDGSLDVGGTLVYAGEAHIERIA